SYNQNLSTSKTRRKPKTESWCQSFAAQRELRLPISRQDTRNWSISRDSGGFRLTCRLVASPRFPTLGFSEWNGARPFPCPIKHCSSASASAKRFHRGTKRKTNSYPKPKRKSP